MLSETRVYSALFSVLNQSTIYINELYNLNQTSIPAHVTHQFSHFTAPLALYYKGTPFTPQCYPSISFIGSNLIIN